MLRHVKQLHEGLAPSPRFVGIDDWAWRKGQRYSTIVVDLERSEVIDRLPDREGTTVTDWLNDPTIELVSRDRSSTYTPAATEGASQGHQVADRWHLLKNLREAIERLFERQFKIVSESIKAVETSVEPSDSAMPVGTEVKETPSELASPPSGIGPTGESLAVRLGERSDIGVSIDSSRSTSGIGNVTRSAGLRRTGHVAAGRDAIPSMQDVPRLESRTVASIAG